MDHASDDTITVRALTVAYFLLGRGHRPLRAVRRGGEPSKIDWVFLRAVHGDMPGYHRSRDLMDSLIDQIGQGAV